VFPEVCVYIRKVTSMVKYVASHTIKHDVFDENYFTIELKTRRDVFNHTPQLNHSDKI